MVRITNFPTPLPDEDFRSIIFRYHLRSANVEFNQTRQELFGIKSYKQTLFPKNLNYFISRLPLGHVFTKDEFLFEHTWYGLYKVFYTEERHAKVLRHFEDSDSRHKNAEGRSTAKSTYSVISPIIRYCPSCMLEDEKNFGEVYVHRIHQVVFLEACPMHHVQLFSICSMCNEYLIDFNTNVLLSKHCRCGYRLHVHEISQSNSLQDSCLNDLIFLRDNHSNLSIHLIRFKLLELLKERGYMTLSGLILKKDLLSDFNKYLSNQSVMIFNSPVQSSYFGSSLFIPDVMVNFIGFYLVLVRFFNTTITNVLSERNLIRNNEQHVISIGQDVIIQMKKQVSAGIEYGEEFDKKREDKRRLMSEILAKRNFKNRSELRKYNEKLYRWLIKHDNEWLEERIPSIDQHQRKIDFHAMDYDLCKKVKAAAHNVDPNYPLPIKTSTILRLLSQAEYNQYRHYSKYLPATKELISRYVETSQQFLIRSIPRNYEKLLSRGFIKMTLSQFKSSSVSYYINGSDEIDKSIMNFLEKKGALY